MSYMMLEVGGWRLEVVFMHSIGWVSVRLQVHAPTEYLWVIKLHKVHLVCYEMMGSDMALVPDRALL